MQSQVADAKPKKATQRIKSTPKERRSEMARDKKTAKLLRLKHESRPGAVEYFASGRAAFAIIITPGSKIGPR